METRCPHGAAAAMPTRSSLLIGVHPRSSAANDFVPMEMVFGPPMNAECAD